MSNYSKVNLKELEDMAVKFGNTGYEARFASKPLALEKMGMSLQTLTPNFRFPFGHAHREQEEVFLLLSGSAKFKIDDEIIEMKPFDAVRLAPAAMRQIESGPDGAEILVIGAPKGESVSDDIINMSKEWWVD